MTAEFDIPSQYAHQISPGQKIFINDKEFKLTQIQKITDEDTHMCPAYVEINNADFQKDFIPGTSIDIQLILEEKTNTVVIPRSAVFIKNKKNFVYVLDKDTVHIRKVKSGISDEEQIEILEGLSIGEQIVTIGQNRLYDGMKVRIAEFAHEL